MAEEINSYREARLQMEGKLPMKREHPKNGESEWYYIDPRGRRDNFTLLSEMKTIDVPSKDTPNPYLQEIMQEEADKNPENYYIWHTVGDDRVRSAHEERDGEIFAWDEPPAGGHPGEDYNCRCTAEPYVPGKKKHKKAEKEWRDSLLKAVAARLREEEGTPNYIYLDTKGLRSVGVGINVDKWKDFSEVNWNVNGCPATYEEQLEAFNKYGDLKKQGYWGDKITSDHFEFKSNLRITEEEKERLLMKHLENDLAALEKYVPEFKSFPTELQEVLLDIRYNTGNAGRGKWPKLYEAIEREDLIEMAKQTHRTGIGEKRNKWAREKILSIKKW